MSGPELRKTIQIDANKLDLEIFRVVTAIDRFANTHRDEAARQLARTIDGMRHRIRKHMHPKDREVTS